MSFCPPPLLHDEHARDGHEHTNMLQLEPFIHQVGGHFPMICLDETVICKPLNSREHRFYQSLARQHDLIPFTPQFHGTMQVEAKEDSEGYIQLKGEPPPNFHQRTHRKLPPAKHYRLKRKESIEIETLVSEEEEEEEEEKDIGGEKKKAPVQRTSSDGSSKGTSSSQFYNPWALKCHRAHLKKLGLIRSTSSDANKAKSSRDSGGEAAASSSEENSHSGSVSAPPATGEVKERKRSRSNPQTYLLLENLVSRYSHPCILDLKVGSRQYADDSSAAKKQRKIDKTKSTTLNSLKLRQGGMQVYKVDQERFVCKNKYFGRTLDDKSFVGALVDFLTNSESDGVRLDVVRGLRSQVKEMLLVLSRLDTFRFYTSSLLVTYGGTYGSGNPESSTPEPVVDVRIIDFAHSTHQGLKDQCLHEGPDEDFIQGLRNLVGILDGIEKEGEEGLKNRDQ